MVLSMVVLAILVFFFFFFTILTFIDVRALMVRLSESTNGKGQVLNGSPGVVVFFVCVSLVVN